MFRSFAALILILILSWKNYAQPSRISVGFWNVENLFDTIPSRFYDDSDYTPGGRLEWDTQKYRTKLDNLARVIDDAGFDLIALAETENEGVVRDLVLSLSDDYNYIHHTSGDYRGIDIAMIYKGDKFFPEKSRLIRSATSREFLLVSGTLLDHRVNLLVCHLPSKQSSHEQRAAAMHRLAEAADSLMTIDRDAGLIIMGDFNCDPSERLFRQVFGRYTNNGMLTGRILYAALRPPSRGGFGTYSWKGRWYLFDNILVSPNIASPAFGGSVTVSDSGVFVRRYMLAGDGTPHGKTASAPLRTFTSGRYTAGYSDHLPVYLILEKR